MCCHFCDEGHERVEQAEHTVEEIECLLVGCAVYRLSVGGFNHFEIPSRELVAVEFVYRHQCLAQTVLAEQVCYLVCSLGEH